MRQDDRAPFDRGLRRARESAYPLGEFVGQESFMPASEILSLAVEAGIGPGVSVLDLCCGVAGPGRYITRTLGCQYVGVDVCEEAIRLARERSTGLPSRFDVRLVPPAPAGSFDVVLLLETMLAFPDKSGLLRGVAAALGPGGRFAFTLEEGEPLTPAEQACMPDADSVWLTPLEDLLDRLAEAGLQMRSLQECTATHQAIAGSMLDAFTRDAEFIAAHIGRAALGDLVSAHRLWRDWMSQGRVRKFAVVAESVHVR